MNLETLFRKVRTRLRQGPISSYMWGFLLRRKFTSGGIIVVTPGWPKPRVINRGGEIHVENCAFFPGVRLEVLKGGRIFIGNGTYLNRNTEVIAQQDVRIGRDCMIAWDVVIMDTDQHSIDGGPAAAKPVVIGDRVWIGCRALILKGVHIGDHAVVGAGAIVTHDVPPGGIVTGPAATLRSVRSSQVSQGELSSILMGGSNDKERPHAAEELAP
ncbi:MAG TPA: acyltransferase [Ktedonobacterales bacterium]|nr:acyltransferase [Ktedonobacterales bacterium]